MTTAADITPGDEQLVVFDLAAETYGVDIGAVREIIRVQESPRCLALRRS